MTVEKRKGEIERKRKKKGNRKENEKKKSIEFRVYMNNKAYALHLSCFSIEKNQYNQEEILGINIQKNNNE